MLVVFLSLLIDCVNFFIDFIIVLLSWYSFFWFRRYCLNLDFCRFLIIWGYIWLYVVEVVVNWFDVIFFFELLRNLFVIKVSMCFSEVEDLVMVFFNNDFVEIFYIKRLIVVVVLIFKKNILRIWMIFWFENIFVNIVVFLVIILIIVNEVSVFFIFINGFFICCFI